jgi:acetyl esterase/lipase
MLWNHRFLTTLVTTLAIFVTLSALNSAPAEDVKTAPAPVAEKKIEAPQIPPGLPYFPGQVYWIVDKDNTLVVDILMPRKARGPLPAVVVLHGGGWFMGNRKTNLPIMIKLAEAGYVAVSVQYRLAPKHPFPAAVHDVKCAVRWMRANAGVYNIDPDRIAALGYSSGGTMACLLGLTTPLDGLEGEGPFPTFSSRVQAVVSYYGISDLAQWQKDNPLFANFSVNTFLRGSPDKAADLRAKTSPITYVRGDRATVFLIHGTKDSVVSIKQSQRLKEALSEAEASVRLLEIEGADHNFSGDAEKQADVAAIKYLDEMLRPNRTAKDLDRRER